MCFIFRISVPELPLDLLDARRPHLEQLAVLCHLTLVLRLDLLHPLLQRRHFLLLLRVDVALKVCFNL